MYTITSCHVSFSSVILLESFILLTKNRPHILSSIKLRNHTEISLFDSYPLYSGLINQKCTAVAASLAAYIARLSAAMVLTVHDRPIFSFDKGRYQLSSTAFIWSIYRERKYTLYLLKYIQHANGAM